MQKKRPIKTTNGPSVRQTCNRRKKVKRCHRLILCIYHSSSSRPTTLRLAHNNISGFTTHCGANGSRAVHGSTNIPLKRLFYDIQCDDYVTPRSAPACALNSKRTHNTTRLTCERVTKHRQRPVHTRYKNRWTDLRHH